MSPVSEEVGIVALNSSVPTKIQLNSGIARKAATNFYGALRMPTETGLLCSERKVYKCYTQDLAAQN